MNITARAWELAARTTRNVRAFWVQQERPGTYEAFVEEFGDLDFEIALHQFHEAYATAGLEPPRRHCHGALKTALTVWGR